MTKDMKAWEKQQEDTNLQISCIIVERHCRSLGKDCQVIFSNKGVEIAPLSDAGSTTGETLYLTLKEAEKYHET